MEKRPYAPQSEVSPLDKRLIEVASRSRKKRRGTSKLYPQTQPNIFIDPRTVNSQELFVRVAEGIERFTTIPSRSAADKILANTCLTADYLVDMLPGNKGAKKFVSKATKFLETQNPELANAVERIILAAKERGIKRDTIYKDWQTNQGTSRR